MLDQCLVDNDCAPSVVLPALKEALGLFQRVLENTRYTSKMPKAALEDLEFGYNEMCKAVCVLDVFGDCRLRRLLDGIPVLRGEGAQRFLENMKNPKPLTLPKLDLEKMRQMAEEMLNGVSR